MMIKLLNTSDVDFKDKFAQILRRSKLDMASVQTKVQTILQEIQSSGLNALLKHTATFDGWQPQGLEDLRIDPKDTQKAYENLDNDLKKALHKAYDRIYAFHLKQKPKTWLDFEENGSILGQKITPIQRVGLYIPGGKAVYPSSLLMNAIPAIVAGVEEIVVCTPTPQNEPNELLLAAMYLCQIKEIYKVGGGSAIGLMAYGVDGVKKVNMITGPGNIFVATAKKLVFGEVGIDMIAGPSEIAIIADESANPKYIAHDLLSQAEHDERACSILITTSSQIAQETLKHLENILPELKRKDIAQASILNHGVIIVAKDIFETLNLSNEIAPEHLEILTRNPFELLAHIKNAGAIFLGENTPEPIGDYIAGPNHTLPTSGSAKFFSPLGTEHFMKKSSIIHFSSKAIKDLASDCAKLADIEGLEAHKKAILVRTKEL